MRKDCRSACGNCAPRAGLRAVGEGNGVGAVVGAAIVQHRKSGLRTERDAVGFRDAVGNGVELCVKARVDLRDASGEEIEHHVSGGLCGGGFFVCRGGAVKVLLMAAEVAIDAVHSFELSRVNHGHGASRSGRGHVGGFDGAEQFLVPVDDDVGVGGSGECTSGENEASCN